MIRVLIVDDHVAFTQPIAFMLGLEPDITVVGTASSLAAARAHFPNADVAIIDMDLPDATGVEVIAELRRVNRGCQTLVLTGGASRRELALAIDAGAAGLMQKADTRVPDLVAAVRRLAAGETLVTSADLFELLDLAHPHRVADRAAGEKIARLTPRERDVLQSLADGLGDTEIAQRMHVGHDTVRKYMSSILAKLELESRLQALIFSVTYGLTTLPRR